MRTIKHGIINFNMVAIPVAVAGVKTSTHEPDFRTLHEKCGTPIKQHRHCPECFMDLEPEDLVKGYEVSKNTFIRFTQEEIDSAHSDRGTTIDLHKFVKASDLTEFYIKGVDKVYWLVPPENPKIAEKYGLLYQCLAEAKKAAVGTESLWGKEYPCLVVPAPGARALQLIVMHLYEDMVPVDFEVPVPGREEKKLAKELIDAQTEDFDPEFDLATEERERIHELIASRVAGEDLPDFGQPVEQEEVDLMGALRASVDKIEKNKTKTKVAPKKKVTARK